MNNKELSEDQLRAMGYFPNEAAMTPEGATTPPQQVKTGTVEEAEAYLTKPPTEYYDFGEWVIVDNDPNDERQVIQYDVLNDEYTLDKNGSWDYFKADRLSQPQQANTVIVDEPKDGYYPCKGCTADCYNFQMKECKNKEPQNSKRTTVVEADLIIAVKEHCHLYFGMGGPDYDEIYPHFQAGYNYAQSKPELPYDEGIWQWLCKRIPHLEGNGSYKFWIKQAFEMWPERKPEPTPKPKSSETDDRILPCPFCGERPIWIHLVHPSGVPGLYCDTCDIIMKRDRHDKAIANWNHRVQQQPEPTGGKSLQECKNSVAVNHHFMDWIDLKNQIPVGAHAQYHDEAAELYAKQSQPQWRETAKELPEPQNPPRPKNKPQEFG